jgi:hypothetical protein
MAHHIFAVTDNDVGGGNLWHMDLDADTVFGDVKVMTGGLPPWRPRKIVDSACAGDSGGNLHVLVVTDNGQLWHTVRAKDRDWTPISETTGTSWGEVGEHLRFPGGKIKAVAAYTKGRDLHLLATADNRKWWRVIRTPDGNQPIHKAGSWVSPLGTPNKFFEEVEFLGQAKGQQFLTLVSV